MSTLSDTMLMVKLPSGNRAVYAVSPQHMNLPDFTGQSLNEVAIKHGQQIAHQHNGQWYEAGDILQHAWHPITDNRVISLLERCPEA